MQSSKEVAGGFFVACGDSSVMLDGVELSLDEIALGVECEVAGPFDLSGRSWRYHSLDGAYFKAVDEAVGIIALVGEQDSRLDLGRQRFRLGDVVSVATGEAERQWIAERVNDHVDFCRETTARAADGLVAPPYLRAPALCWCALTMVASIIAYSLSGSSAKVLKRFLPNPARRPARKALVDVLPVAEAFRQITPRSA